MEGSEVLRDRYGNRIGEIQTRGAKQILQDKYGNRLGEYDAHTNRTVDKYGNPVGSGNLLLSLLRWALRDVATKAAASSTDLRGCAPRG